MTIDLYRSQVAERLVQVASTWTEYPVLLETENRVVVDPKAQQNPFLGFEFKLTDGWQADLSQAPRHRLIGFIILTAKAREGTGTSAALRLLEHFYPQVQHRKIGDVQTDYAKVVTPPAKNGWYLLSAVVPFRVDKTY